MRRKDIPEFYEKLIRKAAPVMIDTTDATAI